jgi:hypothetical protein
MTKENTLNFVKNFSPQDSALSLWVFKRTATGSFSARAVNTTPELAQRLKDVITSSAARFTEVEEYDLLSQVNEVSCLHLEAEETIFSELKAIVDQPAKKT